jgi:hypothetical protein
MCEILRFVCVSPSPSLSLPFAFVWNQGKTIVRWGILLTVTTTKSDVGANNSFLCTFTLPYLLACFGMCMSMWSIAHQTPHVSVEALVDRRPCLNKHCWTIKVRLSSIDQIRHRDRRKRSVQVNDVISLIAIALHPYTYLDIHIFFWDAPTWCPLVDRQRAKPVVV